MIKNSKWNHHDSLLLSVVNIPIDSATGRKWQSKLIDTWRLTQEGVNAKCYAHQ